jgi:glycosyltransferase involved in cell wall biosynthesis
MERDVLKDADSVITVSEPWAAVLRSSLKASAARVDVVENGFDEDDFSGTSYGRNDRLIISYTGKLHRERQPVDALFRVLRNLIREKRIDRERIEVRFYVMGYDKPDIAGLALSYGLEGVVVELGKVSYVRSLEIQRASDAVLFVQWNGIGGDGWYSAKLYDYIGSRRPIIALASGQGIVADLILRTSSGVVASSESDIRRELIRLYDEHRSSGSVRYQGDEDHISRLSRRERALELARILESLTAGNRSRASLERQVV